jgi:hypothetical protein
MTTRSRGEETLALHIRANGLPAPVREFRFAAHAVGWLGEDTPHGATLGHLLVRDGLGDWRFDFAWPDLMLAVEVEGGMWSGGRHNRAQGFAEDCRKYNAAVRLGWRVLRYTTDMVKRGQAIADLSEFFIGDNYEDKL